MSIKTVGQLISELEMFDPETPVLAVYQPSYPLRQPVMQVWQNSPGTPCPNCDRYLAHRTNEAGEKAYWCGACQMPWEVDEVDEPADDSNVYIVVDGSMGDENPYGPKEAFER